MNHNEIKWIDAFQEEAQRMYELYMLRLEVERLRLLVKHIGDVCGEHESQHVLIQDIATLCRDA